jgi:SAM-dependent methyltransferase
MNIYKKFVKYYKTLKIAHIALDNLLDFPETKNIEHCYKKFSSQALSKPNASTLDIGCGDVPRNPFNAVQTYGIDIRENEAKGIKYADLNREPIPFENDKFDYVTAFDFIEHLPRVIYAPNIRFPFVELMNEIHRTLKPGGIFFSSTPMYPFLPAFTDPTHVNAITNSTFTHYFDEHHKLASIYGFKGAFSIKYQARYGHHLICVMEKSVVAPKSYS